MKGILQVSAELEAAALLAVAALILVPGEWTGPAGVRLAGAQPMYAQPAGEPADTVHLQVTPGAETFTDPSTGIAFPKEVAVSDGEREFRLKAAGSGLRKKVVFKVYGAALYVDETASLGTDPLEALVAGDVARRMVMTFKRDVDYDKIHEAYEGGLKKVWKAEPGPDVAPDMARFMRFFDGGVKEGQSIELTYLPGTGLYTRVAGQDRPLITNPKIARDIWAVWLGRDPVSSDLRRDLVRFLTAAEKE